MRTEVDKANVRLNRHVNTFKKTNCDVWQDRPQLVSYEVSPPGKWRSSVHLLRRFRQILQVAPDENQGREEAKAQFIFYSSSTLYEMQRVCVNMDHYEACAIVNETGFEPETSDDEEGEEDEAEGGGEEEGKDGEANEEEEDGKEEADAETGD